MGGKGRGGREREGRGGREKGRVEEDKWVRSVRVRRGVGKGREGESGGRVPEKRERKKGG